VTVRCALNLLLGCIWSVSSSVQFAKLAEDGNVWRAGFGAVAACIAVTYVAIAVKAARP
jgi:hypothetical protein